MVKIVYLLTCRVLGLAVLVFRGELAKDAELLVLRHENAVLRRYVGRMQYEPTDRAWFAALAPDTPNTRRSPGRSSFRAGQDSACSVSGSSCRPDRG
jgi:putative transposase